MSKRANVARVVATLVTFSLGATLAVLVAGSASAAGSKGTTTGSPATQFFVINGTVNAASDHEIVASSAFPNFTTGAVDNYYAMAHAHVDNSPFAEGRASPADTGPVGQTAAAGNYQQPQYADARWPGDPPAATYGSQGGPYATAAAGEYNATADASEASNGLSGPGTTGAPTLAAPAGFDGRLQDALAAWKTKWLGAPAPATPTVTTPVPTVTLPKAVATSPNVTPPTPTVTTPVATVTTPTVTSPAPPPVPVPTTSLPTTPRSLQSSAKPADGETLLTSSSLATLDAKTNTLVTSGESSVGRVSLGGGQIVIEGIHVTASIANDGTPEYKTAVSVAAATIGGVPVTIDEDGVHVAGQGQGLPTKQASDALNTALKQAGIRLFLVGPEVTKPCGQSGSSSGSGTTTTTTTTSTNDQAGSTSSCDQGGATGACGSSDAGGSNAPALPSVGPSSTASTTSNGQSGSCDQPTTTASCDQPGTTTSGSSGSGLGGINTSPTTTSKSSSSTTTTSGCDQAGTASTTSSCGTAAASPTSTSKTDTTPAPSPTDPMGVGAGATNASEETVAATGVHVVFTQPVNQSGVPAQYVEHILGEVFVDSLAAPATAATQPKLDLSSFSASSATCRAHSGKSTSSGLSSVGGSSGAAGGPLVAGGATASGVPSASGGTFASGSQAASGSGPTGNALPAAFAAALRKPLWLLLAYLVWQAIVIATGASLWNWRRGEAS